MSASSTAKVVVCGEGGESSPLLRDDALHERIPVIWTMPGWRKSVHTALRMLGGGFAGRWEPYRPWMKQVLEVVPAALRSRAFDPDAIVTFGHPWVDHEIGLALKEQLRIPWIAHFSDPWVDNPLVGPDSPAARAALRMRESAVMRGADRLIFTSEETVDLVLANYPHELRERCEVLPHCYDPALFGHASGIARDHGVLRCLGKFYGERRPDSLFEALNRIEKEQPGRIDAFRFEIIGNYERDGAAPPVSNPSLLRFRAAVPYLESLRLMASAEALFLVDAPSEKSVFLPSKLIEYIGAGRPVFGITPPGTADRLVRRYGGMTADPANPDAVTAMIVEFLEKLPSLSVDQYVRAEFSMNAVGARFDEIIRSTVERSLVDRSR